MENQKLKEKGWKPPISISTYAQHAALASSRGCRLGIRRKVPPGTMV
jgi:hypothetical protein